MKHRAASLAALLLGSALALATPSHPASATPSTDQVIGRVSVLPGPTEPASTGDSDWGVVSGNGRFVAFQSWAGLVPKDTNGSPDIYVRDLLTDQLELISVQPDGTQTFSPSFAPTISSTGRFVVFQSYASNLVAKDTNGKGDVFIRDRKTGTTELVSISTAGQQGSTNSPASQESTRYDVSDDGRFVAFDATAPEFGVPAGSDYQVFVRDRQAKTTELISVATDGTLPNRGSGQPSMTPNGRYVAFASNASTIATDTNGTSGDVFVRDLQADTTTLVSKSSAGNQVSYGSGSPTISDDGTKVAFTNNGGGITPGDTAVSSDVFVRNLTTNTTTKISTDTGGGEADHDAWYPRLSGDGSTVVWQSLSGEYTPGGGNGQTHIFKRVGTNPIVRVSATLAGAMADNDSGKPTVSKDGKTIVFSSGAVNLVAGDTGKTDIFFRRQPEVGPHGTTKAFAAAVATKFTGAPDAAVASRIAKGSSPQVEVLKLANDPAFAGKRGALTRLYAAYFKRLPDTAGLEYWRKKMVAGMKLDRVSARFAVSSEFQTKYGNTTDTQFVTLVYQNVLNRNPDTAGLAHWVAKLAGGMSRGTVMTNFSESSEGVRKFRPYVDTALVSLGLIGKLPSKALAAAMVTDATTDSSALAVTRFMTSTEYTTTVV